MNQPLHNNAIPPHPGIAVQQQQAATAAEQAPAPAPSEPSGQTQALWDAFDPPQAADPPPPPPSPPPMQVAPQPPPMPEPPPEVPASVEELLGGGASAPAQAFEPPQQPVQAPPAPVQAPAAPVYDAAALQRQAMDYLMANDYRLNDEDRTQLISEPDVVLPKLAARMHVGIATQLAQQVAAALPVMIQQHMETHDRARRAEMEFFGRFPKLNRPEWKPVIAESLQMVKQMNPQATREEIISKGAALAAFQIQSRYGNRNVPQVPQPPRSSQSPYVPAAPGGGAPPPTNPAHGANVWDDLARGDFDPWG